MDALFIYVGLGAFSGVLAGMLGVGGGLVIVPALAFYLVYGRIADDHMMHLAVGTSLATIFVTGISSALAHHRRGALDWSLVKQFAPGLVLGALLGAAAADQMATRSLQIFLGVFEIAVALQMVAGLTPVVHRQVPGAIAMGSAGGVIGLVSSILGIGGGTLTVPFLEWRGIAIRNAVAVSAACGVPIALAGATGFAFYGHGEPGLPSYTTGYIYWPAFAGISIASVLFAPLGARLTHALPAVALRRIFAGFLFLVGFKMLL